MILRLPNLLQELVTLVFDIERMKSAMLEFEIDLSKMPLGKLSRKQIETAYKILTEAQDMIKTESGSESKFLDASNRFFTLIPHDFGMRSPPLLDNPDLVKAKIEMLDNLLEIEVFKHLICLIYALSNTLLPFLRLPTTCCLEVKRRKMWIQLMRIIRSSRQRLRSWSRPPKSSR